MDVKSKINFINSVAGGQKIPCPKCNTLNEADAKFCITCGSPIVRPETAAKEKDASASAEEVICKDCGKSNKPGSKFCVSCGKPLNQNVGPTLPSGEEKAESVVTPVGIRKKAAASVPEPQKPVAVPAPKVEEVVEESNVFAEGLPAWDVVPPQVMVRRKRR